MHKLNRLFNELTAELWNIKRYESQIDFKELVDFWKAYQSHINLVNDTINAQIIAHDGCSMPFSEEDISYMVEAFITCNKYNYDRLIAEALFVLDNAQAYQYLNKILDTAEKRAAFKKDFGTWTHWERVKEELRKLGNEI